MASPRIRFSDSREIALGLALIIAIGTASMLFIYRGPALGELHAEFTELGHALMGYADDQERLYAAITGVIVPGFGISSLQPWLAGWSQHPCRTPSERVQDVTSPHAPIRPPILAA